MAYSIVSCNLHKHLAQTGITDEREKWKKEKSDKKEKECGTEKLRNVCSRSFREEMANEL